jgi:hypothetical protein
VKFRPKVSLAGDTPIFLYVTDSSFLDEKQARYDDDRKPDD